MMCTKIHDNRSVCLSSMTNQPADGTICGQNKVKINMILKLCFFQNEFSGVYKVDVPQWVIELRLHPFMVDGVHGHLGVLAHIHVA